MQNLHLMLLSLVASRLAAIGALGGVGLGLVVGLMGVSQAAPAVAVRSSVNCPGTYLSTGSGKTCQAGPEYKDLIYLGENTRKECKFPYTRINAGDSKWCVLYPDP